MPDILEIANSILLQKQGKEQIEVYVSSSTETEVVAYDSAVESLTQAHSSGVGIRIINDGRVGFAHAGSLASSDLTAALDAARENSSLTSKDDFAGLATPDGHPYPTLQLFDEDLAHVPLQRKVDLALELERMVFSKDHRINQVPQATYGDVVSQTAIVSTAGISVYERGTFSYLFAYALAREDDDTQTGFGYSVARKFSELDLEQAASDSAERATRLLGAKKPSSKRLTVVFEPRVTANLLSIVGGALSAESIQKGRSIFLGRLGEQVSAEGFTLIDDPTNPMFQTAGSSDAEGLATRKNVLFENGELKGYLYDSYTARKGDVPSSASAVRGGYATTPSPGPQALSLIPGSLSQQQIISDISEGVLVQSISGIHSGVSTVSGDFSVGAEGVMIRNGELAEGIREATIASTLQRMLADITCIGADVAYFPGISAGVTMTISDMSLSGS